MAERANPSLWAVHGVEIGGRAAIEWYEVDAVTDTLLQTGTISDPHLGFNYPSIAVNDVGEVVIGFSGAYDDPTNQNDVFMSTFVTAGETVGGMTTFGTVVQTRAGVSDYEVLDGNERNRWGDYRATVVDPVDDNIFWTFQEFVNATDQWQIHVTQVSINDSPDADFNQDGNVDGDDFLAWQTGFGISMDAGHSDGDADFDGDVDGDDFLIWQNQFGSGNGPSCAAVPEPTSIMLLFVLTIACWCSRSSVATTS